MKRTRTLPIGMLVVCFMVLTMVIRVENTLAAPANGTVVEGGLAWLQNANCFGPQTWAQAMSSVAGLQSGRCGLTDDSKAGDWRLPTKLELMSRKLRQQGFNNVQDNGYWTSNSDGGNAGNAWIVSMYDGLHSESKTNTWFVWPVRRSY